MSEPKRPFIPSWLDDLGLGSREFRVLCHLWRRGVTHSTLATIGTVCRIKKRDTVIAILNELERLGLISIEHRPGLTNLIKPVPPNGTGDKPNQSPHMGHPVSPETGRDPYPETGHHPPPQTGRKGNPTKGIPKRVSKKGKHRTPALSDEQFVDALKANPAYAGINIDHEIGKMKAWLLTKPGRKFTHAFAVNWLNRTDKPMTSTTNQTSADPNTIGGRTGTTTIVYA